MRCLGLILFCCALALSAAPPVPVVFDTDMGNDIDDALALAMLHSLETRGETRLIAVTLTKSNAWAAEYVRVVNEFYGRAAIPVGLVRHGKTPDPGNFVKQVSVQHGHVQAAEYPDAVKVLRESLSAQPDGSVVIVQVGFSTNLAALLESPPDAVSPLSGRELATRKVRLVSVMAGNFNGNKPEFNIMTDVPSAQKLVANWPGDMVFSGFEIGNAILYPAASIEHDFVSGNPVPEAYRLYQKMPYDRPSWDLTAVLYAFRPDRGYFSLSDPGQVSVTADGRTDFQAIATGHHRFLKVDPVQAQRSREALLWLASERTAARY